MKKIVLFLFSFFLFVQINTAQNNQNHSPYIETIAQVDTLVVPDRIHLKITLSEKDSRNRESVEELEGKMARALENLGIDLDKQLTLSDLASNFKMYFLKNKSVLKDKTYSLKVYDAPTAGKVLQALEILGISNVSISKLEFSTQEELELVLKTKAVEKAKVQAEYLIKPFDQKVTKVLYIIDRFYRNFNQRDVSNEVVLVRYGVNKKVAEEAMKIDFKPIKVEAQVTVRFQIK